MKETIIRHPSETIIFGEKKTDAMDYYMDFYERQRQPHLDRVEQSRHGGAGPGSGSGGSDYGFADGSANYTQNFPARSRRSISGPSPMLPATNYAANY